MHPLTNNFECWISKDGQHFTVHDIKNNSADGGYELGEYAKFDDEGVKYLVTMNASDDSEIGTVDLKKEDEE